MPSGGGARMRVVGFLEPGGPEVLRVHRVPEPHAGPGQVRIAVRAAAVNPVDVTVRQGRRGVGLLPPPHVPGMDAAGVLDEVGPATDELDTAAWAVGDRVMTMAVPLQGHGGAYVEFLVAHVDAVARMPRGLGFAEAATVPMNGLTALQALDLVDVPTGGTLAVTGAAGVLGGYVVQLATQRGLRVVADAAPADRALVERLGATWVLERGPGFADHVRVVVPSGVDGLVDAAVLDELALSAVRDGGRFASLRRWTGVPGHPVTVTPVWVYDDDRRADRLDLVRQAVEIGALTPRVAMTMPVAQAAQAHRRLERGGLRGRIVLTGGPGGFHEMKPREVSL